MNKINGLKILNPKEFESKIKSQMMSKSMNIIDSIVDFCEKNGIEIETVSSLISPRMKSEIETEAINSRMIISKKARLPI